MVNVGPEPFMSVWAVNADGATEVYTASSYPASVFRPNTKPVVVRSDGKLIVSVGEPHPEFDIATKTIIVEPPVIT